MGEAGRAEVRLAGVALAVAALSALVIEPAPSYDPWAWLLWGREIAHGTLSTAEGPAFKPLTVAATTLLAPLVTTVPLQVFACHLAMAKGLDVDQPRNLAKSVTVE